MAIGSPNITDKERAEAAKHDKAPVAKTEMQAEHLGVKAQKGAKKKE